MNSSHSFILANFTFWLLFSYIRPKGCLSWFKIKKAKLSLFPPSLPPKKTPQNEKLEQGGEEKGERAERKQMGSELLG